MLAVVIRGAGAPRERALRRGVALLAAAAFAVSLPGRATAVMAMGTADAGRTAAATSPASQSGHGAGEMTDCPGPHGAPHHAGMPAGSCCSCCGPTCEGCTAPAGATAGRAEIALASVAPPSPARAVAPPAAASQLRQPLPIGPPSAPLV